MNKKVVAIGFLTQDDLNALGAGFRRHFPISTDNDFADLINKLDAIDVHANDRDSAGDPADCNASPDVL